MSAGAILWSAWVCKYLVSWWNLAIHKRSLGRFWELLVTVALFSKIIALFYVFLRTTDRTIYIDFPVAYDLWPWMILKGHIKVFHIQWQISWKWSNVDTRYKYYRLLYIINRLNRFLIKISTFGFIYLRFAVLVFTTSGICGVFAVTLIWMVQNCLQMRWCLAVLITVIHFCLVSQVLT